MTEKTSPAGKPAKGDDRNLVAVDEATAVTFEDRLFVFWKKHRNTVLGAVLVVLLAIAGLEAWKMMERRKEQGVREAFGAASTLEAKRTFAREHGDHPLGGLALLALADDAYAAGRYEEAMRDYAAAAAALGGDNIVAGRARLGEAVVAIKAGQTSQGVVMLQKLAEDPAVLETIRNQAWYELAAAAADSGDYPKAREIIDRLVAQDLQGWGFLAQQLRERLPAEETPLSLPPSGGETAPESVPAATPAIPPAP